MKSEPAIESSLAATRQRVIRESLRVVFPYVLLAAIWIYASDELVRRLTPDVIHQTHWSELKGFAFVLVTAGFLWMTLSRILHRVYRAQTALQDSERHFRAMFEQAAVGVAQVDTQTGQFVRVNQCWCELLGYTPEEMRATNFRIVTHPDDLEDSVRLLALLSEDKLRDYSLEKRYRRKDGTIVWVNLTVSALWAPGEPPSRHLSVIQDITERKQAEARTTALTGLALRLSSAHEPSSAARAITETALELWHWDAAFLLLHDARTDTLQELVHVDTIAGRRTDVSVSQSERQPSPQIRRVLREGPQLIQRQNQTEGETTVPFGDMTRLSRSLMYVPLRRDEESIGVLSIQSYQPNAFTPQDLETLQALADHCSGALARLQAEAGRRETEERFHAFMTHSPMASWIVDLNGRLRYVNPVYNRLFGANEADLTGKRLDEVFPADLAQEYERNNQQAAAAGQAVEVVESAPRPDGTTGQFLVVKFPTHTAAGEILVCGKALDITERIRAEEALRLSEERLRLAAEAAHMGMWDRDLQSNQLFWSAHEEHLMGYEPGTFPGTPEAFLELIHPESEAAHVAAQERARTGDGIFRAELRFRLRDGTERWGLLRGRMFYDAHGLPERIIGVDMDITERKRAEGKIRELNETLEQRVVQRTAQLEAANKELEAFSYSVSHDLRAPLRAVDGYARILEEDHAPKLDAEGLRVLDVIRKETRRMGQLIDDLLAFSRLGRGQMRVQRIDMTRLAQSVFDECAKTAAGREIRLQMLPLAPASADPAMMRQALTNLIANAVKYTRPRTVAEIEISSRTEGANTAYCIKDNGVGFDMRYVDKLFGIFQRLHHSDEFEGTGVGLALVQRIIRRHGGRIWAESQLDAGATFSFTLPVVNASPA